MRSHGPPPEPTEPPDGALHFHSNQEFSMPAPAPPCGTPAKLDATAPACCGGPPRADASACCALDEAQKAAGNAGCGCSPHAPPNAPDVPKSPDAKPPPCP